MRFLLLAFALVLVGCVSYGARLDQAAALARGGKLVEARQRYIRLTRAPEPRVRVLAELGAAHASLALKDLPEQRRWLELATSETEVPGVSEEVYFELAELLRRDGNRAQALSYYYRAAAGAERHAELRQLYDRAISAIAGMGMAP